MLKTVVILASALFTIAISACDGASQPLPDIDATVEARVELAKASLVAPTAPPLPTYTPVPTYTPAPVKEVVKEIIVEKIVEVVKEVIVEKIVVVTAAPLPTYTPMSFYL